MTNHHSATAELTRPRPAVAPAPARPTALTTLDFRRSFLFWETDFERQPARTVSDARQNPQNLARVQIDCRCEITAPGAPAVAYYLGASCKTERVGASRELGLFIQPNADFRPVLSAEHAIIFKSWDRNDKGVMLVPASLGPQPERQIIPTREAFYRHRIQLAPTPAVILTDIEAIIAASNAGSPLVARTEFERGGYRVALEYPVFTFNVSDKSRSFQTDTGPVLFPELDQPHQRVPETLRLAYSAFHAWDWIEFIVQRPTPLTPGISVNHYSETIQIAPCRNSLLAVTGN